jgi:hypothetical protein
MIQPVLRACEENRKPSCEARHQWITPLILATPEAEIQRIVVQSQPAGAKSSLEPSFTPYPISTSKQLGMVAHNCHPS